MVSGIFRALSQLPNPADATILLKEINILAEQLNKTPPERIKAITNLLEEIIDLQRINPGTEPLKMAVEMIVEINKCDVAKIQEIRSCIKEAGKLPLKDIIGPLT